MNCKNNVVVAVLAGVLVGTLIGAGTSQYAYVVAGWDPNYAKGGEAVEEVRGSAPTARYEYTNTRALRLGLDNLFKRFERDTEPEAQFDPSKYAEEGPCAGMSGKRRNACEAGRN